MKKFVLVLTSIALVAMIATTIIAVVALCNLTSDGAYECAVGYGATAIGYGIIATLGGVALNKLDEEEELEDEEEDDEEELVF